MKFFLLALAFSLPTGAHALAIESGPKDHLAFTNGARGFCNIWERLLKKPEVNASCEVIMTIDRASYFDRPADFGQVNRVIDRFAELDGTILIVTTITVEQLDALRFDPRILLLAPNGPVFGNGAFTVRNGKAD